VALFTNRMTCTFCDIASRKIPKEVVFEDEFCLCIRDRNPVSEGHSLVIPKKHIVSILEASELDWNRLNAAARLCAKRLVDEFEADGINILSAHGAAAQQSVFHLHIHLVPRKKGDGLNLWFN
jgi:diadenosine tetraphosphate (Ap4A) HIT family hydrolase